MTHKLIKTDNYLLIVDDSEIKKGDCYLSPSGIWFYNNLNPNKDCKKVIAHLPLNDSPILEGVDLLPNIEDDVEQMANTFSNGFQLHLKLETVKALKEGFKYGYNKAKEKFRYTEEDIRKAIDMARPQGFTRSEGYLVKHTDEEIIQSLSQYPTEFECEMVDFTVTKEVDYSMTYSEHEPKPKTITTAKGAQWVGKYK